jgi:hypothetical protein
MKDDIFQKNSWFFYSTTAKYNVLIFDMLYLVLMLYKNKNIAAKLKNHNDGLIHDGDDFFFIFYSISSYFNFVAWQHWFYLIIALDLQHIMSRIRKKTFYLQYCMGTPEGIEFTGWIQNPKTNYWNTKSINQKKKFKKKTVFRTLKVERGQKYARTEFEGPTQNPKKISEHQINQSKQKISQKKLV